MDNIDVSEASWRKGPPVTALTLDRAGGNGFGEVSLVISPGERVALVGPDDGAADAVLSWLRGDAKPGRGRILIGGAQVKGGPAAFWTAGVRWAGERPKRFGLKPAEEGAVLLRLIQDDGPALPEDDEAVLARRPDLPGGAGFDRIALFDAKGLIADDTPAALRSRFGG